MRLKFERLHRGHYYATDDLGRAYVISKDCGDLWMAHHYENEDTPYGQFEGSFCHLSSARVALQEIAKAFEETELLKGKSAIRAEAAAMHNDDERKAKRKGRR